MLLLLGPNVAVLDVPTPDAVVARVLGELSSLVRLGVTRFVVRWGAGEGLLDLTCCDDPAHEQGPVERVACRRQCLGDGTTRSDRGQAPCVGPPRQIPCRCVAAACDVGWLEAVSRQSRRLRPNSPGSCGRPSRAGLAVELQPAGRVLTTRVVMCPVDDAALWVPLVFTVERDRIAGLQRCEPRGEVDVVGDQAESVRMQDAQ